MFFVSYAVWRRNSDVAQAINSGDGGDHAHDVETDHTVIYAVGSTGQLFDVVAGVEFSNERCTDRAQDVGDV